LAATIATASDTRTTRTKAAAAWSPHHRVRLDQGDRQISLHRKRLGASLGSVRRPALDPAAASEAFSEMHADSAERQERQRRTQMYHRRSRLYRTLAWHPRSDLHAWLFAARWGAAVFLIGWLAI
jgi:hypothetical protein